MAGLEGLGALPRIGGEEVGVRVGQGDHPQVGLAPHAGDLDDRLAEVELGVTGRMAERDEDLLRVLLGLGHGPLDLGDPAGVAVLVTEALEDPPRRVALLGWGTLVGFEDLVDDGQEGPELGLGPGVGHLVAGGLGVRQDLVQGLVADPVVPEDRALGGTLHQDFPADLRPHLHVGVHPSPVCSPSSRREAWEPGRASSGMVGCCRFRPVFLRLRCCRFRPVFTVLRSGADSVPAKCIGS